MARGLVCWGVQGGGGSLGGGAMKQVIPGGFNQRTIQLDGHCQQIEAKKFDKGRFYGCKMKPRGCGRSGCGYECGFVLGGVW